MTSSPAVVAGQWGRPGPSRILQGQRWLRATREVAVGIGALADRAGISAKAIRRHERIGVLPERLCHRIG